MIIATDYGIYATEDARAIAVEWTYESSKDDIWTTPVYAIRQQEKDFRSARNPGAIYIGTFGRGIWKSNTLLSSREIEHTEFGLKAGQITISPNPAKDNAYILVNTPSTEDGTLQIYDINGRLISTSIVEFKSGDNKIDVDVRNLHTGLHFVTISQNGITKTAKLIKQ